VNEQLGPPEASPLPGGELPLSAALFSAFICMLFGANAVAIKISLTGIGIFTAGGIRFTGGAAAVILWAILAKKPLLISREQVYLLAPLPLILFVQLTLFYQGQSRTLASHGAVIANLLPFVVMILGHFFLAGERMRPRKTLGLLLGFSAVYLLFADVVKLGAGSLHGNALILSAVIIWGAHVIYIKTISARLHPVQITVYPMLVAGPVFLLCGYLFDPQMVISMSTPVATALFYQTFITTAFGFAAWNSLIQKYGATSLHSFVFIVPISGVFLGVVLLGEPLTTNIIGSIVLVVIGLAIVNKPQRGQPTTLTPEERA
jgi:drug/metabolite transporter (DMT)-like permease